MQITYGATVLAGAGATGARMVSISGSQAVDEVQLFRAASAVFYSRGNKRQPLEFSVLWAFNTRGLAEKFMLTHLADLATSGDLTIVCGDGEPTTYTYVQSGSVLDGTPEMTQIGLTVLVKYSFKGGLFAAA